MDPILVQDFLNLQITTASRETLVILLLFEVITIKEPGGGGGGEGVKVFPRRGWGGELENSRWRLNFLICSSLKASENCFQKIKNLWYVQ